MKPLYLSLLGLVFSAAAFTGMARAEGGWITAPGLQEGTPVVLHFRREIDITRTEKVFRVRVSADNRFVLYVNGQRVGQGPARGDLKHWRFETIDIAPFLKTGHNVVAAEVWNAVKDPSRPGIKGAPFAQITARTGLWVEGEGTASGVDTSSGWRVSVQPGHDFASPFASLNRALKTGIWYAAAGSETIDGARADWAWAGPVESKASWSDAVPALSPGEKVPWTLQPDALPAMMYAPLGPGKVVRADLAAARHFPQKALAVPANTETTVLIDQARMISAYPEFVVSGGKGATITVTYAEALYDDQARKGDRSAVDGRKAIGLEDTFLPDGSGHRTFRPVWWRTWRFMQITVKTASDPLTMEGMALHETGYPFAQTGYFKSSDAELNRIWEIGWRTLRVDAHETFMDSSYWEQLQYVGDTRLENLIAYSVSGDPKLPVQAIDAFGQSARPDGMIQSAYPSSTDNIIPTFGLLWIGMMHDYWMRQPDQSVILRNLPGARKILDWYAPYVAANGLLKRNPEWNFVDWVGDPALAREKFPSFDTETGTSCMTSLLYLGALKQAADLETAVGDAGLAKADAGKAATLSAAIQANCWDASRGLYADDPSHTIFSQHTNALAVLYDVAPQAQAAAVLQKVSKPKGVDAPDGILESSYYFSWYLIHAFEHAGLGDRYLDQLQTWRDLARLNYTTWPEQRGTTRSDTHAWSAHPTTDLVEIVAGIQPASPGYASARIAPHVGGLKAFDAVAATPKGGVRVRYKAGRKMVTFRIAMPEGLPGKFEWGGQTHVLKPGNNTFAFAASAPN